MADMDESTLVAVLAATAGLPSDPERMADLDRGWQGLQAVLARLHAVDTAGREPWFAPEEDR